MIYRIKAVICALWGHSGIQDQFWGQYTCARCDQGVGDSLAGAYSAENVVIVGHDCGKCRENYKKLRFVDKLFIKYPFSKIGLHNKKARKVRQKANASKN